MPKRRTPDGSNVRLQGRSREMALLGKLVRRAAGKNGSVIFISGEAGIGKTALLRAALANADFLELNATANPVGGSPLAPVVTLLYALQRNTRGEVAERAGAALRLLTAADDEASNYPNRAVLFGEIVGIFAAGARKQPLSIVLDDAHWADHATLELLPQLAELAAKEALLVFVAYRDEQISRNHPMCTARDAVRRSGRLEEIALAPLGERDAAKLSELLIGEDVSTEQVKAVAQRSGGVPLFIEALAGILRQRDCVSTGTRIASLPLPGTIRDAVLMRFDLLPPHGRQAAESAVVGGSALNLEILAEVDGNEDGIDALLESNLLVERGDGFAEFRTPFAQEVVYSAIPWTRRRALHRRYADVLARRDENVSQLADHWLKAGESGEARRALLEGAARSRRLHAHHDAVQALRRALEIWPQGVDEPSRLTALDQLGDSAQLAGLVAEAQQAWREVAESATNRESRAYAGRALRKLANLHEMNCEWNRAIEVRQEAISMFALGGESAEAALEGITAAIRLRMSTRYTVGLEFLVRAEADAEAASRPDLKVRINGLKGNLKARLGLVDEGIADIRGALEAALTAGDAGLAGEVYQRLADATERSSKHKEAASIGVSGITYCDNHGLPGAAVACLTCMGWILVRSGDWEEALSASQRILDTPNCPAPARAGALLFTGLVELFRGELRKAEGRLIESEALSRRVDHALGFIHSSWGLAMHAAVTGDAESALQRCRNILRSFQTIDPDHSFIPVFRWAASCFARAGDRKGSQSCSETLSRYTSAFSNPEALSALAHSLGEVAWLDGDPGQAAEHFGHAVRLIEDWDSPRERVESQLRASSACAEAGQFAVAADFARAAARGAERLGARPLVQAAVAQLRELGQPLTGILSARGLRRVAQGGLTARQREILVSISRGQTDKEIARALRLSPRTVEMHVAHALAALDCRNRAEAVRKATESGVLMPLKN